MRIRFLPDGESRLQNSPEFEARLRELHDAIRARHAAEMAAHGFVRRLVLRWNIAAEYRRERRKLIPSSQSLYGESCER